MSKVTEALNQAGEGALPEMPRRPAMIATSHPDAVAAGRAVLDDGGNAVDAAVAAALALGVVDPMSTGLGGDCFALVWQQSSATLHGINGSGRSPAAASLADLRAKGFDAVPADGALPVTVPGALRAFDDLVERFGDKSLAELIEPALALARDGFTVTPVVGRDWHEQVARLRNGENTAATYLVDGRAPAVGATFAQPDLAASLEAIAAGGVEVFYEGPIAKRIVATSERLGGWLTLEDLTAHRSLWVEPLEGHYRGHQVFELPPNGQGVVALEALALLDELPLGDYDEVQRTHFMIEALKVAFADCAALIADPESVPTDPAGLLGFDHVDRRLEDLGEAAAETVVACLPDGDTVYVCVVDADGNAVSLIYSVYMHFGSAVVADGTGIVLQNRGNLFSADPAHPNALAGAKLPYHTIMPAMVFRGDRPWLVFGVVGGYQQPQAQVQLLVDLIDRGMSLEEAVAAPRFRWLEGLRVRLEQGTAPELEVGLRERGHLIGDGEGHGGFGGAQAILIDEHTRAPTGASDPRKDGLALLVSPSEHD